MCYKYLLVFLLIHRVLSDECIRYVFEDYDDLFTTEVPTCSGLALWSHGTYDESPIAAPNEISEWFITPSNTLSCTGSFEFTMMAGALVEVNVYFEFTNATDIFVLFLMQRTTTGNHVVVGTTSVTGEQKGWQQIRLKNTLTESLRFQGYIVLMGTASANSDLIVDSFRYVPPTMDSERECILYEDTMTTPTETPTTEECVRYYFEDYDDFFTTESPYCDGFLKSWSHETYDNSTIAAPNENSKWFIRATAVNNSDCTASFLFTTMPGAIAEANVYLETVAADGLFVDLMQITETGVHRTAGWTHVTAATGWQVIRVEYPTFTGNPPFQGYMRFLGRPSPNSIMIVDSFRYVPSSMDPEEECILYEDFPIPPTASPTTTTRITTTKTDQTTTPTTAPTTPTTTQPNNLTNYYVEELFDFRKSIRISKKRTYYKSRKF